MDNSRLNTESSDSNETKKRFSKLTSIIVLGAFVAALIGVGTLVFFKTSTTVTAASQSQKGDKKFKATKKIVVDKQTGELRKPTDEETTKLVADLVELTKRPAENLESSSLANGGVAIDLEGGYAGTMLARPNADGTFETRCVFTFEEAAAFLGLEEDNSL